MFVVLGVQVSSTAAPGLSAAAEAVLCDLGFRCDVTPRVYVYGSWERVLWAAALWCMAVPVTAGVRVGRGVGW